MSTALELSNVRVAPQAFEAQLRAQWPDFRRIEWDPVYCRWRFFFTSAAGRECSLLYCWDRDPRTGGPPETDVFTGLRPFRDLDADAQAEILFHGERTSLTNPANGLHSWSRHGRAVLEQNERLHATRRRAQAEDWAYALQQVDLRRRWLKDHPTKPRGQNKKFGYTAPPQRFVSDLITRSVSFGKGRKTEVAPACASS